MEDQSVSKRLGDIEKKLKRYDKIMEDNKRLRKENKELKSQLKKLTDELGNAGNTAEQESGIAKIASFVRQHPYITLTVAVVGVGTGVGIGALLAKYGLLAITSGAVQSAATAVATKVSATCSVMWTNTVACGAAFIKFTFAIQKITG